MKRFRESAEASGQMWLLPPSVRDYVGQNSPVRILGEIIDRVDLSELDKKYKGGGAPAYEPRMMLKVLIFAYSIGMQSSRKIDAALGYDMRFMFLSGMHHPDFRTISTFRKQNSDVLEKTFKETVKLAMEMGLVLLQHVSVDGTKMEANVSGRQTYKRERLDKAIEDADKQIQLIMQEAEKTDREEDTHYQANRGDEVPQELEDAKDRKARLEEIKKAMEEAGRDTVAATDTESRVMKTTSGNRPAYNCQAVVDSNEQVIVAEDVTQAETDNHELSGMIEETKANTGMKPSTVTADGGYYSPESLKYAKDEKLDAYIPDTQGKAREGFVYDETKDEYTCPEGKSLTYRRDREADNKKYRIYRCYKCGGCPRRESCHGKSSRYKEVWRRMQDELQQAMSKKIRSEAGKATYGLRKQIVEPVFGNIKANKGIRRLFLRGLIGASIEFHLACIAHNLGKIAKHWRQDRWLVVSTT